MNLYLYSISALFAGFALLDLVRRGRDFPAVRGWRLVGLFSFFLYFAIATQAPDLWDGWLGEHRLADLSTEPLWLQIVPGIFVLEFGIYAWHRTMHRFEPLWRIHQLHHSAERIDIWGAFYFHPLDMLGWALLGSLCLVGGIGISADAALVVGLFATFCSMFQHANIRTPRWLGYLITRPESHSVHHQRDVHGFNYGDVPWFDMLFGTFRNPESFDADVGLSPGSSRRLALLLIGRAVS